MPSGTQECIAELQVTDDKSTAQTFFDSNQYAYDSAGDQFTADTNGIYLTGDKDDTQVTLTSPSRHWCRTTSRPARRSPS